MPPLITPRTRRRFGEIVVAVGLAGALWGPVGSAEAGVSADPAADATFASGSAAKTLTSGPASNAVTTGSLVGKGAAALKLDALQLPTAQRSAACSPSWWASSGSTRLGGGWTTLNARAQPCTSATVNDTWLSGTTFSIYGYTDSGTFICRGTSYAYGTAYWYKTSRGWVWSGATANPIWQKERNC
jgi:hypothetical protein